MGVEHPLVQQLAHHELREVLRMRIDLLFDQGELFDDRTDGADPAKAEPRREHLRKTVDADDDRVRLVQLEERRRRRRTGQRQLAVGIVLDDGGRGSARPAPAARGACG